MKTFAQLFFESNAFIINSELLEKTFGQALLYYNHVNTVTKNCILGKAWEAQLAMLVAGKKCQARSVKKWLLQNQPQEVAGFLHSVQPPLEITLQLATTYAFQSGTAQSSLGTVLETTHIHPTCLAGVRGWAKSQVPWCNAPNVRVGAHEARAPPPSGFPHTMLSVKRIKDNMRLAFIEKLFTNHEIGTSIQTRYLCFKGMSYESKNYLCDISYVQLWKALARFQCGNTHLEVMLGAWKGVPYTKRLCRGYDLGKVEDEEHLLLAYPNTQKVKEHFCSALPLTHTNTLVELMQITNMVALAKFVACCQYQRTICPP